MKKSKKMKLSKLTVCKKKAENLQLECFIDGNYDLI